MKNTTKTKRFTMPACELQPGLRIHFPVDITLEWDEGSRAPNILLASKQDGQGFVIHDGPIMDMAAHYFRGGCSVFLIEGESGSILALRKFEPDVRIEDDPDFVFVNTGHTCHTISCSKDSEKKSVKKQDSGSGNGKRVSALARKAISRKRKATRRRMKKVR
uniref:Uncharacterized protein n=1 Tax=Candidatus Kentrum sp. UNK TaxID=2126344 RepID=A0A451AQS0_9GAMM|nr:MAG: hypothetical protein BECKUNK1418G_GA0071005_100276 [Candidatus Kentron sp. UNK]VFK68352.1 MAG: hypothetical protein BECKUNK1418H_GA0071006_100176 [Candidatus Kentron sp. UNK]